MKAILIRDERMENLFLMTPEGISGARLPKIHERSCSAMNFKRRAARTRWRRGRCGDIATSGLFNNVLRVGGIFQVEMSQQSAAWG